ncbi:hypothetical protein SAMN05892883_3738 [Jatrophihabitans sp. GAS493]|uniref:sulfite exporter TauE/SafE family protein n=1 Tax=Jatrophihabitans sp. GAS493 TaxID=1907575 RepID=UPI000BB82BE7|nr:sulfite exporter TauE/SafE family protein [Jatrophihabitans sp. GAS493]SOD74552.1 hypothetical protein SAMN05892883_3738 [Jatrophihabitans sp. GAS493]
MTATEFVLLVLAGVGAGLAASVAGLASLVSYPALLAVGLTPVAANVTNTVAMTLNTVGSVSGSYPELSGQRGRVVRLVSAALVGGIIGGALVLLTPADAFEKVVPWLIALASVSMFVPRRRAVPSVRHEHPIELTVGVGLIGIYGGYFGAASGVLMLALLLRLTDDSMPRSNALKNVALGVANAVAAVGFALFGPVNWAVALPLAIGFGIGGRLGPIIARSAPETPLRIVIALLGLGLALDLGIQAYG